MISRAANGTRNVNEPANQNADGLRHGRNTANGTEQAKIYLCLRLPFRRKVRQAAEKIHYIYNQRCYEQLPENERQAQKVYHQPFADYPPGHGRVPLVQPACYCESVSVEYAEKVTVVGFRISRVNTVQKTARRRRMRRLSSTENFEILSAFLSSFATSRQCVRIGGGSASAKNENTAAKIHRRAYAAQLVRRERFIEPAGRGDRRNAALIC